MTRRQDPLSAFLQAARRRWRSRAALRAGAIGMAAAALVLATAATAGRLIAADSPASIALWACAAVAVAACLAVIPFLVGRSPDERRMARLVEERCPELDETLVTAVEARGRHGRLLAPAVVEDAIRRMRQIDLDRIVRRRLVWQWAGAAAAVVCVLALATWWSAGPVARAARLASMYAFPERLAIDVRPGDARVRAGGTLRIVARVDGPDGVVPVLQVSDGEAWHEAPMQAAPDGFSYSFDGLQQGFQYRVSAVATASPAYTVTVVRAPRVERIDVRYEYPAGLGLEPREESDGGDIYGPVGTRVRLTIHADKPVTEGALTLAGGETISLTPQGATLDGTLTIAADGSYRVALGDADGLRNPGDTEYFIRTLVDRPPDVRITAPGADRRVSRIDEVPIEARAEDDFGIAAFDLVYAVGSGAPQVVPFARTGDRQAVSGAHTLYLEELGVQPGDFVTYYARARDVSRGSPVTEARSDIFFLEVAPFDQEFTLGEGGGQGGGDPSIAEMVEIQKEIISATWNLDRRGRNAGARSDVDIRTVAGAQRDLRARGVAMVTQMRRTAAIRRLQPGGRARAAAEDPAATALIRATEAMRRAQEALDALRTAEALPAEMEALNELLRAQAQTRRQQIQRQQQAGGSGSGAGRDQQDLSSLFDRELARDQRTQYETRRDPASAAGDAGDELAERLRELARRQGELARQQRELADRPDRAAARRELERLTREQSELRAEAEQLARELEAQAGRRGDAGRALREAAEDMQGAASELRRQNPGEASARGSRAGERLRELEQQLRGGRPDDRRRALGEMELESRQLAEAQRRLAREGAQASEQQRLADRAERLEESVRQLAETGRDRGEREALAGAARELEREALVQRMRDPAAAQREGEAIARTLDEVADALGAALAPGDDRRELRDELARLREQRQQLAELDRRLQEQRESNGQPSWQEARELIESLRQAAGGLEISSTEGFSPGRSAPGTEPWKQDFARWDALRVQLAAALEESERRTAAELRDRADSDRVNAGGSEAIPDRYRRLIEEYYRALAGGR